MCISIFSAKRHSSSITSVHRLWTSALSAVIILCFCLTLFFVLVLHCCNLSLLPRSPCGNTRRGFGFQCQSCPIPDSAPDSGLSSVLGSGLWYVTLVGDWIWVILLSFWFRWLMIPHKIVLWLLRTVPRASDGVVEDKKNDKTRCC